MPRSKCTSNSASARRRAQEKSEEQVSNSRRGEKSRWALARTGGRAAGCTSARRRGVRSAPSSSWWATRAAGCAPCARRAPTAASPARQSQPTQHSQYAHAPDQHYSTYGRLLQRVELVDADAREADDSIWPTSDSRVRVPWRRWNRAREGCPPLSRWARPTEEILNTVQVQ